MSEALTRRHRRAQRDQQNSETWWRATASHLDAIAIHRPPVSERRDPQHLTGEARRTELIDEQSMLFDLKA